MTILADNTARADDFINESERDATPANDDGRVPKLESDAQIHPIFSKNGFNPNAGETINGGTLPVPVYQDKTDNEVYACDANDNTKYKFIGFAISNSTDGNSIQVQTNGVVNGFTGLSEGEKYYVQDTAGTIGTSVGTQEILVGIAISETALLIQLGKRFASGTTTFDSTTTTTITTGFRPSKVTIYSANSMGSANSAQASSVGGWTQAGGNDCAWAGADNSQNSTSGTSAYAWDSYPDGRHHYGIVDTITDTGFRLNNTEAGGASTVKLFWEAEGEL